MSKKLNMIGSVIEYLKDPHLVAKIQKFFGVNVPNTVKIHHNGINHEVNGKKLDVKQQEKSLPINNYFWYYLFLFGTELGDETFYSAFICFWFWNVDGAVGRKIILLWSIIMTTGQIMKDIICWPRPACPPAVRLQTKWSQEYGMPSTHAMVGVSIPFSIVLFTMDRYVYPLTSALVVAVLWCSLICMSRLYLGMHTVLDVVAGLVLAVGMMIPMVPFVNFADHYLVTNEAALFIMFIISIATIIYYPRSTRWAPTRGDTAMVVSVTFGAYLGAMMNYKTGLMYPPLILPPYNLFWPTWTMLIHGILRTIFGFVCVMATKPASKSFSYKTLCAMLKINSKELMMSENSLENKNKVFVDLFYKYFSCFTLGVFAVHVMPRIFSIIGIERASFYTEL